MPMPSSKHRFMPGMSEGSAMYTCVIINILIK